MDKNDENIVINLIIRHLSKESDPGDEKSLQEWLDSGEDNRKMFEDFRQLWEKMEAIGPLPNIDIEAEWKHQESLIRASGEHISPGRGTETSKERFMATEHKAGLIFIASRIAMAAVVVFALIFAGIYINRHPRTMTIATADEHVSVTLPDGSMVTLNSNSVLEYPRRFMGGTRDLSLAGEAFFQVEPDPESPFNIETGELDIRVLGTSFNVNAYDSNEEVEVVVETGQVAVTRQGEIPRTVILKPGSKAVFNRALDDLSLSTSIDKNYLAWKTRSFIFEDRTLAEVAEALNRVYGSEISIPSDSLREVRITSNFSDDSLAAILHVLSETLDLEVVEFNGRILLRESY